MQYHPLDYSNSEIRVLHILPHAVSSETRDGAAVQLDTVHCTLTNVSLNDYTSDCVEILQQAGRPTFTGEMFRDIVAADDFPSWQPDSTRWNWGDFAALSYTWGDAMPVKEIVINGTVVDVRENLEGFLQQFSRRQGEKQVGLWIDALCINQADEQERNSQVKQMRNIYQQASTVYAWLGPEREDGPQGMDMLVDISGYKYETSEEFIPYMQLLKYFPGLYSPRAWRGFWHLVLCPYWNRLWIIQELALGDYGVEVMWGDRTIMWRDLRKAIDFLQVDYELTVQRVIDSFLEYGKEEFRPEDALSLHVLERLAMLLGKRHFTQMNGQQAYLDWKHIFSIGRGASQSDPRDKVYGLLALMPPNIASQIRPDYSATVLDVYTDFAKTVIVCTESLDIICQARTDLSARGGFPTWVPDWSTGYNINVEMTLSTPYCASGDLPPEYMFIGSTLTAKGFIIDHVDGLSDTYKTDGQAETDFTAQPRGNAHAYSSREGAQEALFRTMLANRDGNGQLVTSDRLRGLDIPWPEGETRSPTTLRRCFDGIRKANAKFTLGDTDFRSLSCNHESEVEVQIAEPLDAQEAQELLQRCYTLMIDRRLMITQKGHFGLVTKRAEQGDVVCVLVGCSVPVLLRPAGHGTFWLVGETYVHGFMDGEALQGLEKGVFVKEDFIIS